MYTFITSLLKSLNGASKPWQLSLALSLSILGGFLPFSSLISYILLFVAFSINIPIGLYFGGVAIFSIVGFVFDGLFAYVGDFILHIKFLEPLFISMNNNIFFIWTNFNNTSIMGAFVVGSLVAIVSFFVFKKYSPKITQFIEYITQKSKIIKFLMPGEEEQKQQGIFRAVGLCSILGIFAFVVLFVLFAFDFLIKLGINSASNGRVVVNKVQSDLVNFDLQFKDIVINNQDGQEVAKIKLASINASSYYGVRKKVFISSIDLIDFNIHQATTNKQSDSQNGKSSDAKQADTKDKSSKANNKDGSNAKNINIDEILKKEKLQSYKEGKKLQKMSKMLKDKWSKKTNKLFDNNKLDSFKNKYNKLQNMKISTLDDYKKLVQQSALLIKDLKQYTNEITANSKEFEQDKQALKKQVLLVDKLYKKDYEYLLKKYGKASDASLNIVKTYISPTIGEYLELAFGYYKKYGYLLQSDDEDNSVEQTKSSRYKGEWVRFKSYDKISSFYVKRVLSNGDINGIIYKFKADDITDNHAQLNKPTKAYLVANNAHFGKINANLHYDSRVNKKPIKLDIKIDNLKVKQIDKGIVLRDNIIDIDSKNIIYNYKNIKSNSIATFAKTKISVDDNANIDELLKNVKNFDIKVKINGDIDNYNMEVSSNLDTKLKQAVGDLAKNKVGAFGKKLKQALLKKQTSQLEGVGLDDIFKKFKQGASNVKNMQNNIGTNINSAKNKAEQKAKSDIAKKAESKIKDLIKF